MTSLTISLDQWDEQVFPSLISRHVFPTKPPCRVPLEPLGESLLESLGSLVSWSELRYDEIRTARARFDQATGLPGQGVSS